MIHSGNSQMDYHLNIDIDESEKDKFRYNQVAQWIFYNLKIILELITVLFIGLFYIFIRLNNSFINDVL